MGARRVKEEKGKGKPKKEKKEKEKKVPRKRKVIEGIRGIVRLAEVDIHGERKVKAALLNIRGIGQSLAKGISVAAGIDPEVMIGSLNDEQLKKLEDVIKNPNNYGIPSHMLNFQRDITTGENKHFVSSELRFKIKSDIDFLKKIRAYRGVRHELGLPVRGQRTRSSFRTGARVGVSKGAARKAMRATKTRAVAPTVAKEEGKTEVKPTKEAKPAEAPKSEKPKEKQR